MAFQHQGLDDATLGPGVLKVLGPGAPAPLRGMVAKGLAPLGPRDLLVALYQLWATNDPDYGAEAAKTVSGLPSPVLMGALDEPQLPPGVLDFMGRKLATNVEVLERIVRHGGVDDQTIVGLARVCPETICDIVAANQQRWMVCPAIVESLYQNPACRMSVIQGVLELAVRQGVDVNLPNMEEIKAELGEGAAADPERDEVFRQAAGERLDQGQAKLVDRFQSAGAAETVDYDAVRDEALDDESLDLDSLLDNAASDEMTLPLGEPVDEPPAPAQDKPNRSAPPKRGGDKVAMISRLRPMEKIRLALLGSAFERAILVRDSNKSVALSAIKSPRIKENEVVGYAANRTLSHDIVRYIARQRHWTKLYAVKLNLVLNPKTPMAAAMSLLGHLHPHDVRKVAHSRNIPSALAQAAKRKTAQRR